MIDVADAQRLLVTGGETVAEIVRDHGGYRLTPITIEVDGVPEHCMTTGIAANGEFLYLACARIHRETIRSYPASYATSTRSSRREWA